MSLFLLSIYLYFSVQFTADQIYNTNNRGDYLICVPPTLLLSSFKLILPLTFLFSKKKVDIVVKMKDLRFSLDHSS